MNDMYYCKSIRYELACTVNHMTDVEWLSLESSMLTFIRPEYSYYIINRERRDYRCIDDEYKIPMQHLRKLIDFDHVLLMGDKCQLTVFCPDQNERSQITDSINKHTRLMAHEILNHSILLEGDVSDFELLRDNQLYDLHKGHVYIYEYEQRKESTK